MNTQDPQPSGETQGPIPGAEPQTTESATKSAINIDEKTYIILMHASIFLLFGLWFFGFAVPLLMWLLKKDTSKAIDAHGKEVVNFHIAVAIYFVIAGALMFIFIGFLLAPVVAIFALVCGVLGAVKASNGEFFRYPLTLRLIV